MQKRNIIQTDLARHRVIGNVLQVQAICSWVYFFCRKQHLSAASYSSPQRLFSSLYFRVLYILPVNVCVACINDVQKHKQRKMKWKMLSISCKNSFHQSMLVFSIYCIVIGLNWKSFRFVCVKRSKIKFQCECNASAPAADTLILFFSLSLSSGFSLFIEAFLWITESIDGKEQ